MKRTAFALTAAVSAAVVLGACGSGTPTAAHHEHQSQEHNLEGGKAQPGQRQTPRHRLRSTGSVHQGVAWHQKNQRRQAPYGDGLLQCLPHLGTEPPIALHPALGV